MAWSYTESGSNTASTSWDVANPSLSEGDLFIVNIGWDDSTNTDDLTAPLGPNGEVAAVLEGPVASDSTSVRGKIFYYIALGSWSAGTLTFTASAAEQWTAVGIKIPAAEFSSPKPIGAHNNRPSTYTGMPFLASLEVGADDGEGRIVSFVVGDADNPDGSVTGWTEQVSRDRGAVGVGLHTRDALATASESIASATGLTFPTNRNWVSFIYVVRPVSVAAWYSASWQYRVPITISAAEVDEEIAGFPIYVDLSDLPTEFHTNVKSDGGDIRVTESDGITEVPRDLVFYNSGNGELYILADTSRTINKLYYIYYGNAAASDYAVDATYGAENVWTDYQGVWHMSETSGTVRDSTANDHDSTSETITTQGSATSKFGTASDFNGTTDVIEFGDILDLGTNDVTIEAWVYVDATGANDFIVSKALAAGQDYRYGIGVLNSNGHFRAFMQGDGGADVLPEGSIDIRGGWHFVMATFDRDGNLSVYTDAADEVTASISSWAAAVFNSNNPFRIGSYTAANNTDTINELDGKVDEVRIKFSIMSAGWRTTQYANQNSPSTFYSAGSEEASNLSSDSERSAKTTGAIDENDQRPASVTGQLGDLYSKEFKTGLPTDDANLKPIYSAIEVTNVSADDTNHTQLQLYDPGYAIHLYKKLNNNNTDKIDLTWKGRSNIAPSSKNVYMQIFNYTDELWETVDSETAAGAFTEFTLTASITANLSEYYDANNMIAVRIYQEFVAGPPPPP